MKKYVIFIAAFLVIIGLYIFTHFSLFYVSDINGYYFGNDSIYDKINDDKTITNSYVETEKIKLYQSFYQFRNSVYVGEKTKKAVDTVYPIFSKDNSQIVNLNNKSILINDSFTKEKTYKGLIITGGKTYNQNDYEISSNNTYYFLRLDNGLFVNLFDIIYKIDDYEFNIPSNSIISFQKDTIKYYVSNKGKFIFNHIDIVNKDGIININKKNYSYYEMLESLDLITISKEKLNLSSDVISVIEPIKLDKEQINEEVYKIPEVKFDTFESKVYTATGTININDESKVIKKYPTFTVYMDKEVYLTKQVINSGIVSLSGLEPGKKYTVVGTFTYYSKDNKLIESTFYKGEINTKTLDTLNSVKLSYDNNKFYANKLLFSNLKIDDYTYNESIKGISKVVISTNNNEYPVSKSDIEKLSKGQSIEISTSTGLKSNKVYDYKILFYDKFNNLLPFNNNSGSSHTIKETPSVNINTNTNFTSVDIDVELTNKDNVDIDNFYYEIYNSEKNMVQSNNFNIKDNINIENLDDNAIYYVYIYSDYDLNDGNGIQKKVLMKYVSFTTVNLSKLKSLRLIYDYNQEDITSTSSKLNLKINFDSTEMAIITLLDYIDVKIYDKNENYIKTYKIKGDELNQLKNDSYDLNITGLASATEYFIDTSAYLKIGDRNYEIDVYDNLDSFSTNKSEANFILQNSFVSGNLISFDIKIDDKDNAIIGNRIIMSMFDNNDKLIDYQFIETNKELKNFTFDKLTKNTTYKFSFMAESYDLNDGNGINKKTFEYIAPNGTKNNYYSFTTTDKLSGKLQLNSLLKIVNSRNNFDITNKDKWIAFGSGVDLRDYDINNKIITLGLKAVGSRYYSYYVPELKNKKVKLYFNIKSKSALSSTFKFSIINSKNTKNELTTLKIYDENNLLVGTTLNQNNITSKKTKLYSQEFTVNNNGYISFYLEDSDSSIADFVQIIDYRIINVEESDIYNYDAEDVYDEDQQYFLSNISFKYSDQRSLDSTSSIKKINNLFIEICDKNNNCLNDNNLVYNINSEGNLNIDSITNNLNINPKLLRNTEYTLKLKINVQFSENNIKVFTLDTINFTTENEIRSINKIEDLMYVHNKGKYIVNTDLDFTNVTSAIRLQNSASDTFYGKIDFQGHKLLLYNYQVKYGGNKYIIYSLGRGGEINNVVLDIKLNNVNMVDTYAPFVAYNYGTIKNIKVDISNYIDNPSYVQNYGFITYSNSGTIENFAIDVSDDIKINYYSALVARNNDGTIKNGYIVGDGKIDTKYETEYKNNKNIGLIAGYASGSSLITNVYTTLSLDEFSSDDPDFIYSWQVGNIVGTNNSGTIRNSFSTGLGLNRLEHEYFKDINIGSINNINSKNLYYISNNKINNSYSTNVSLAYLSNKDFIENLLNYEYNMFSIDENIKAYHYPTLKWPNCMPKQNLHTFTKGSDSSNVDFIDSEEISETSISNDFYETNQNKYNTKELKLKIYNNNKNKITEIGIKGLNVQILKQEDTKDVYSYVYVKVSTVNGSGNEIQHVSYSDKYYLTFINGEGFSGPKKYYDADNDSAMDRRTLLFSLYKEINDTNDWVNMNDKTTNFVLMNDLDFSKCYNKDCNYIENFTGKLEGNNKKIKNITSYDGNGIIKKLSGTIKNFYIENYIENNSSSYSGFIYNTSNGAEIDNIHISGVHISNGTNMGALVGYLSYGTITNSSVSDFNIDINDAADNIYDGIKLNNQTIGGLVGISVNSIILNCSSYNFYYNQLGNLNSGTVGSLVGTINGGILSNSIAEGKIYTSSKRAGGLVGSGSSVIKNNITKVDIYSERDYTGGIIGDVVGTSLNNVYSNITIGDIYSSNLGSYIGRTVGYSRATSERGINYSYSKQAINGVFSTVSENEIILDDSQLMDEIIYKQIIGMDTNFDYSYLKEGYLPQITYSYDNSTIINPNKKIQFTTKDDIIVKNISSSTGTVTIDSVSTDSIKVDIKFDNNYFLNRKIKKFSIKDESDIEVNETNCKYDGESYYCHFEFVPNNYYDNYNIESILISDDKEKTSSVGLNIRIDNQMFKYINNATEWKDFFYNSSIKNKQNIILTNDIDLGNSTISSINSINRIKSLEGKKYKISNVKLNSPFINTIMSEISNVAFENFVITSNLDYVGIIGKNSADLENISFNNIIVTGKNYVGVIGNDFSNNINNVNVTNAFIYGIGTYTGGFVGYENKADITNVNISNVSVKGIGYVGGMFGRLATATGAIFANLTLDNSYIVGGYNVGGIVGSNDYNLNYAKVTNSYIIGSRYTNNKNQYNSSYYIGGIAGTGGGITYCSIENTTIIGNGKQVGGIAGYYSGYSSLNYDYVVNSKILNYNTVPNILTKETSLSTKRFSSNQSDFIKNNISSIKFNNANGISTEQQNFYLKDFLYNTVQSDSNSDVGGIIGFGYGSIQYSGVKGTDIYSETGNDVGGLTSRSLYTYSYYSNYITNTNIKGNDNVGGILGNSTTNLSYYNLVNANVDGNNNVGGAIGYADNSNATSNLYYTRVSNSIFAKTTVKGNNNIGALIGYTVVPMTIEKKLFNNIIEVDVTKKELNYNTFILGNYKTGDINNTKNLLVYNKSSYNYDNENIITPYVIGDTTTTKYNYSELIDADSLYNPLIYYTSSSTSNPSPQNNIALNGNWVIKKELIDSGFYPSVKTFNDNYPPDQIKLPEKISSTTSSITSKYSMMSFNDAMIHVLPSINAYTVDSDKINIDFSNISDDTYFSIKYNNDQTNYIPITKRTFTFTYDFKNDFEIIITDGYKISNKTIKVKDLLNNILTIKNDYYYIENGSLVSKDKKIDDDFINLYGTTALTSDGKIYDIQDNNYIKDSISGIKLLNNIIPLYEFIYNGTEIKTFGTYSISNEKILDNKLLYVKNNNLIMLSNSLEYYKDSFIIDSYNNSKYQTLLGKDGKLYELGDNIIYPDEMKKSNIKDMTNTILDGTDIILIEYNDGSITCFNYKNGKKILDTNSKTTLNIFEYLKVNLSTSSIININKIKDSKKETTNLIEKLKSNIDVSTEKESNEIDSLNINKETTFITMYEPLKKSSSVYNEKELLGIDVSSINSNSDISINDVILKSNNLKKIYLKDEFNIFDYLINGVMVLLIILILILITIFLFGKNIINKKQKTN